MINRIYQIENQLGLIDQFNRSSIRVFLYFVVINFIKVADADCSCS